MQLGSSSWLAQSGNTLPFYSYLWVISLKHLVESKGFIISNYRPSALGWALSHTNKVSDFRQTYKWRFLSWNQGRSSQGWKGHA